MDERITRFKYCDSGLHPYLDKVLARLPEEVREDVLNNKGLQVLADAELHEVCGRRFDFDHPVEKIVYLNMRALSQPDHRLLYNIADEIADYVLSKEVKATDYDQKKEGLLIKWGFEKEVNAVRYCEAVAKSAGFKAGYEWAKRQNKDYLLLHFGLYYDEWNEKGLARMSKERIEMLRTEAAPRKILPGLPPRKEEVAEPKKDEVMEGFSLDETVIEGVMAAVKEIKLQDQ
jgi:hypothetical protein